MALPVDAQAVAAGSPAAARAGSPAAAACPARERLRQVCLWRSHLEEEMDAESVDTFNSWRDTWCAFLDWRVRRLILRHCIVPRAEVSRRAGSQRSGCVFADVACVRALLFLSAGAALPACSPFSSPHGVDGPAHNTELDVPSQGHSTQGASAPRIPAAHLALMQAFHRH